MAGPDNYRSITPNHLPKTLVDQSETMAMAAIPATCHDETRKGLAKVERTVDKSGWNKGQPDQKVPKNKTTIRKPGKEKQIEDDNTKLRLAMKTWLEQPRSSQ